MRQGSWAGEACERPRCSRTFCGWPTKKGSFKCLSISSMSHRTASCHCRSGMNASLSRQARAFLTSTNVHYDQSVIGTKLLFPHTLCPSSQPQSMAFKAPPRPGAAGTGGRVHGRNAWVGCVGTDSTLANVPLPGFRSEQATFELLTAGTGGRGNPEHLFNFF